ncbi:hypothetical protein CUROG_06795 [Corynebacterium urogenitale]|uniref:Long Rib domain-containing protein n=2 Tax=Corynebacterium urogenitale TaxID=2487892 RepID=A0A5J6ZAQ2_9CORY|nr:hypothetical protein CUROG_06795 [Corynebacterium urogenitale]
MDPRAVAATAQFFVRVRKGDNEAMRRRLPALLFGAVVATSAIVIPQSFAQDTVTEVTGTIVGAETPTSEWVDTPTSEWGESEEQTEAQQKDAFEAEYGTVVGDPGDTVRWSPSWLDESSPEGATFEVVGTWPQGFSGQIDHNTGDLWVTAPIGFTDGGTLSVPILIEYDDGTREFSRAYFKINPVIDDVMDADIHEPSLRDLTTPADRGVSTSIQHKDGQFFPVGTAFTLSSAPDPRVSVLVERTTGSLQIIPLEGAAAGNSVPISILVSYPDGSSETVTMKVTLTEPVDGLGGSDEPSARQEPTDTEQSGEATDPVASDKPTVPAEPTETQSPTASSAEPTEPEQSEPTVEPAESSSAAQPEESTKPMAEPEPTDTSQDDPRSPEDLPRGTRPTESEQNDVSDPVRPESERTPTISNADPDAVRLLPSTQAEAEATSGQNGSSPGGGDSAETNETEPSQPREDRGADRRERPRVFDPWQGVILVKFDTLLDLVMTGLPFVVEMIKDGRIRVPESS